MSTITVNGTDHPVVQTEVLIVGSGPVGATYARKLVDAGIKVLMVEMGPQERPIPGEHKKNSYVVQKDINNFIEVVKGELELLSIPTDKQVVPSLEPVSWSIDAFKGTIHNGQNPDQDAYENLTAAAATRAVGGMSNHWTCATPRMHPKIERPTTFTDEEWETKLYPEAEALIGTNNKAFDDSIRNQLVQHVLAEFQYPRGPREFISLPLAVQTPPDTSYLVWGSAATVFGDITEAPGRTGNALFTLRSQCQCTQLIRDTNIAGNIQGAMIKDVKTSKDFVVQAKKYVICAGAVLTPGILYNSGWRPEPGSLPALGHYLTEQTMMFCQIVLDRDLVDNVIKDPFHLGWTKKVEDFQKANPLDPLPFPYTDPDPQSYTPVSDNYPWHTQIHRDAFSYGQVPAAVDQRLIVDFRWFGLVKPIKENWVEFGVHPEITDQYGMPQPTFHYKVPPDDAKRAHVMMADMVDVATKLGGWLPGAEPQNLAPGSALHIGGTCRAGTDVNDSVVDKNSKVWGTKDLYIGGCSVIPTGYACNPTLTAMCYAIVGSEAIIKELKHPSDAV